MPKFIFALREDLKDNKQFLPKQATDRATGYDVRSAEEITVAPNSYFKIPLGIRVLSPEGWWLSLKPRSSTFTKKFIHCLYGTIDEDFEGQMIFAGYYCPPDEKTLHIQFGEAIGQLIPVKRIEMEVDEVSNEELDALFKERAGSRGANGFGSSGR